MTKSIVVSTPTQDFFLWEKMKSKKALMRFNLEITARCNNTCKHCFINLPVDDRKAKEKELSFDEIMKIADEAISLGALWCLITGGEPLLRKDFFEIYHSLKKKGLLVSVFTNATLVTEKHIKLFKKYPPREIEVSVYGVNKETYEGVTKRVGSFTEFIRGLNLLLENGVKVGLKTMILRSNVHEMHEIARFCRDKCKNYFRFDPFLHLRIDGNQKRNDEIKSERLSPEEILILEQSDPERFKSLKKLCDEIFIQQSNSSSNYLFQCGAGINSFTMSYEGGFHLCSSLHHLDCIYDLKKGSLSDAMQNFVPKVRNLRIKNKLFLESCHSCSLVNLCMMCPALAHLETGEMDSYVDYFCKVAHARVKAGILPKKT